MMMGLIGDTMASAQFTKRWSRDVLLVEDDDDFREGLADILRSEGYSVRCAANGLEALDYLKTAETHPKVILLDLMMPVMDGWDFRSRMLAESSLADIPVILMSGARDISTAGLQAAGALDKPVELSRLLRMIEGQLLDTCALCRGPIREVRRTVVVRGAVAATLCDGCQGVGEALETELAAMLERFAESRKHAIA
jgi:CheY-like chemotaxis protein